MKENGYNAAEVVEIGKAEEIILGTKTSEQVFDSSLGEPLDRRYIP